MGMEGINWEGVNSEAKAISDVVTMGEEVLEKMVNDFADELCGYWASGNAVRFGKMLYSFYTEVIAFSETELLELERLISRAAQIYATTFNVDNGLTFEVTSSKMVEMTANEIVGSFAGQSIGNFKEQLNGQTGINKSGAQSTLDKFKGNMSTFLDELTGQLSNRDIPLFDIQNEQKSAYELVVVDLRKGIEEKVERILSHVTEGIETEFDNSRIAKERTVATFSA